MKGECGFLNTGIALGERFFDTFKIQDCAIP